jgi:DNA-binding LytR/AlgR family response regulator
MKCIVIDDEQLARNLVESYVLKVPFLELVGSFKSGTLALEVLKSEEIDLVITDIQMPDLLGTELVKLLSTKPLVVFTTAYQNYAIEGFELEAIDYLLKPFSFERFSKSMNKAKEIFDLRKQQESVFKKDFLTVKADHKLYKINYADIKYIEGMREYVSFYFGNGRVTALLSLKSLEEKLPADQFIRCHKSFIVNKSKVTALDGGNLILSEKSIPIGQSYRDKVIEAIF